MGAVLFLILPLLVGQIGLLAMLAVVLLANSATIATAFSLSDSATNLSRIGAGGMYALSRHSLGNAFGGSIGIQIFAAQAVSIGFYAIGFAEPLEPLLRDTSWMTSLSAEFGLTILQRKQLIATVFALVAFIVAMAGSDFVSRLQLLIFVVLIVAIGSILVSPLLKPNLDGVTLFADTPNLNGMGVRIGFAAAFAIFFPAVTGIDAGVGMSGSLKTPQRSLVRGTFAAIGVTTVIYIGVTLVFGFMRPQLLLPVNGVPVTTIDVFAQTPVLPIILITGILLATSSSALSYFMTAPSTCKALADEDVLPKFLKFLGKDIIPGGRTPRVATILTLLITLAIIWSGDIAFISLIVGICFLVVYGWVNFATFMERVSGNPSFRPTSRGHWLISLYGFLLCLAVIALFNIWVGLAVLAVQFVIFLMLLRYKSGSRLEGVWWGALFALLQWLFARMQRIVQGTKNWRPIVGAFAFVDRPNQVEGILSMANRLAEHKGIVSLHVLCSRPEELDKPAEPEEDDKPKSRGISDDDIPDEAAVLYYAGSDINDQLSGIIQSVPAAGFGMNTVLLPVDSRFDSAMLIEHSLRLGKHILLYKPAAENTDPDAPLKTNRIDVWWKGAENGNLMALLAFVVKASDRLHRHEPSELRLLRKLDSDESPEQARKEMEDLLADARLYGEVVIIDDDDTPIAKTVYEYSHDARLVFLGMPGRPAGNLARFFNIDRKLFQRNFEPYAKMPQMLFVKAAGVIDLSE